MLYQSDVVRSSSKNYDITHECHERHSIKQSLEVYKGVAKEMKTRDSSNACRYP